MIGTDYKQTFSDEVDKLIQQDLTTDFKNTIISVITEQYIEQTGEVPDSYELNRLASWLVEDKSRDGYKVSKTDYPVLTESQQKYRRRKEREHSGTNELSDSGIHKIHGRRAPKNFLVFGEYDGGN